MAWTIAHIASEEALRRAVVADVRSEGDPFRAAASAPELAAAGIAIAANKGELSLLDKCMRETHRLYGGLLFVREVRDATFFLSPFNLCFVDPKYVFLCLPNTCVRTNTLYFSTFVRLARRAQLVRNFGRIDLSTEIMFLCS